MLFLPSVVSLFFPPLLSPEFKVVGLADGAASDLVWVVS